MSITSVSSLTSSYASSDLQSSKISESTKRKLQALGIDYTSVTSETQAQTLISAAQMKQQVQKTNNQDSSKNTCSSESELISRAKSLASQMGVSVSSNESLTEILSSLSAKISSMSSQAAGDSSKIRDLQRFQSELSSIQSQYSTVQQSENSMYTAMNYTATMNKYALGLS